MKRKAEGIRGRLGCGKQAIPQVNLAWQIQPAGVLVCFLTALPTTAVSVIFLHRPQHSQ
jgi:hypothetical protein